MTSTDEPMTFSPGHLMLQTTHVSTEEADDALAGAWQERRAEPGGGMAPASPAPVPYAMPTVSCGALASTTTDARRRTRDDKEGPR